MSVVLSLLLLLHGRGLGNILAATCRCSSPGSGAASCWRFRRPGLLAGPPAAAGRAVCSRPPRRSPSPPGPSRATARAVLGPGGGVAALRRRRSPAAAGPVGARRVRRPARPQRLTARTGGTHMQSKRDQVQAHMFVMGRLTSGMLRADPDAPESPQGRTNRGVAIGVIIAVLIAAGSFVFGLIKPGTKDSWRAPGPSSSTRTPAPAISTSTDGCARCATTPRHGCSLGADMKTASVGAALARAAPRTARPSASPAPPTTCRAAAASTPTPGRCARAPPRARPAPPWPSAGHRRPPALANGRGAAGHRARTRPATWCGRAASSAWTQRRRPRSPRLRLPHL